MKLATVGISLVVVACSSAQSSPADDETPVGGNTANPPGGAGGTAASVGAGGFGTAGSDWEQTSGGSIHSGGSTSGSGGAGAAAPSAVAGRGGTGGGAESVAGASSGRGGQAGSGGAAINGGAGGSSTGGSATGGSGGGSSGCEWTNPEGRIVLFDGSDLSAWGNSSTGGPAQWRLVGDGSMEIVPANPSTNIQTTMKFEDVCLHLEYMTPMYPANVTGQQRGNSGIYFKRAYEMQVLDSHGQPPELDGCGAVYNISPPLAVACNMQLVWNTYEIEFRASRWDGSRKTANARFVLATLNDTVVQRNVDLNVAMTTAGQPDAPGAQPLQLQDHGNTVRFRNIWAKVPNN